MLVHVVLIQLRSGVSSAALRHLERRIRDLAESVAGPDTCVVGPNVTEEPLTIRDMSRAVLVFDLSA
jgi:hypothetical protein